MGSRGAIIMGFFGAVFIALTLSWQFHVAGPVLALPFLGFLVIAGAAVHIIRQPGEGIRPSEKVVNVIMWSSMGEGIGLFLVSNLIVKLHHEAWLLPVMALVVGAHFIPIALAAAYRPFMMLGIGLMLTAVVGFVMPSPIGGAMAGFLSAAALWSACTLALFNDSAAKRAKG